MATFAFIDESLVSRRNGDDVYVLGAVVLAQCDVDSAQEVLLTLKSRSAKKLHWRDEQTLSRRRLVKELSSLPLTCCVVVRSQPKGDSQERQRRLCLERLFHELDYLGVSRAVIESRGNADDRRDMKMLQVLRSARAIGPGIRMEHIPGPKEPMLWAADVLCGAVAQGEQGVADYFNQIASLAHVHRI
ncbi:DUF3800 domain-containing protein [Paenarthrobacter sp. NPDC057355]|uniref:DUF3800 domain-containing protein n=1 Tax=Paenarthrobacter sp. NPDC057355 TaxID=3346105 RepID=UPI003626BF9B